MADNLTKQLQQQIQQDIQHLSNVIDSSALVNRASWEKFEADYNGELSSNAKIPLALFKEICSEAAAGFWHEDLLQHNAQGLVDITFATVASQKKEPKGQYSPHKPEDINNAKAHLCLVNCAATAKYIEGHLTSLSQEDGQASKEHLNNGQQVFNAAKTLEQELVNTFVKPADYTTQNAGSHAVFAAALSAINCCAITQDIINNAQLVQETIDQQSLKATKEQQPSGNANAGTVQAQVVNIKQVELEKSI